ncbi:acyl carrier protein [Streptomyces sp. I05A-00742]|uniref:acyl carrier protein n=1 Tax=Streptomyces sp. I05A-00742 TaxID=2732853 RepID=UPI0014887189|nr:acyl carrier protein [Streptomyces sp. I05A-00742]
MAQDQTAGTDEIEAKITAFIRERFLDGDPKGELDGTTPLLEWGVLNSVRTVVLLNYVRTELGVTIPPRKLNSRDLKDVRSIAALIGELAASSAA